MQILETNELLDDVMPDRNLTIKIVGLALFQITEGGQWNVFFPKAENHPFQIKINKKIGFSDTAKSQFILPTATVIDFLPDRKNVPSAGNESLSADSVGIADLHKTFHNETLVFSDDLRNYAGFLTLNGTTLVSEAAAIPTTLAIWDAVGDTKTKVGERTVGNILKAGFMFDSAETARIDVKNDFGFSLNLSFEEPEVSYEVTFFNDCEGMSCGHISDFKFYYNIINKQGLKGKFELVPPEDDRGPDGSCSPVEGGGIAIPTALDDVLG